MTMLGTPGPAAGCERRYGVELTVATLKVIKRHPRGYCGRCRQTDCEIGRHARRIGYAILKELGQRALLRRIVAGVAAARPVLATRGTR